MTAPVDPSRPEANLLSVWRAAAAYSKEFGTVEVEVDEEDEEASASGGGTSGDPAA